jgi:hypothetical protein
VIIVFFKFDNIEVTPQDFEEVKRAGKVDGFDNSVAV